MQGVEAQLETMIDEALDRQREEIDKAVRKAAERILARRLAKLEASASMPEGEWLSRNEIAEQYGISYSRVRDAQVNGRLPSLRRGKTVYSRRDQVDMLWAAAA